MQILPLAFQVLFAMHQPRPSQLTYLRIVVQDALHDAGLFGTLFGREYSGAAREHSKPAIAAPKVKSTATVVDHPLEPPYNSKF